MVPTISDLSNAISRRQTRIRLLPDNRKWLRPFQDRPVLWRGAFSDITDDVLSHSVIWVDPYENDANRQHELVLVCAERAGDNFRESSPLEAAVVASLVASYVRHPAFDIRNVSVSSSYSRQVQLVRFALRHYFTGRVEDPFNGEDGEDLLRNVVSTVASSQGTENWLIIYTPGKGPDGGGVVGQQSLLDNARDVFVNTTRAKQHLVYVGSRQFMRDNCVSWLPVLDFLPQQ